MKTNESFSEAILLASANDDEALTATEDAYLEALSLALDPPRTDV